MEKEFQDIEAQLLSMEPAPLSANLTDQLATAMANCIDSSEIREVEADLAQLIPQNLSEDQLEVMTGRMELASVEASLEKLAPVSLDSALLSKLTGAMEASNLNSFDEKLIEFQPEKPKNVLSFFSVAVPAAAAVIALLAIVVFSSNSENGTELVVDEAVSSENFDTPYVVSSESPYTDKFHGEASNNLKDISNEGVFTDENGQPFRKIKLNMEEVYKVEREEGKVYKYWSPKERVIYLPIETN